MEISQFLQRKETAQLRLSFLDNVVKQNKIIRENLSVLEGGAEADPVGLTEKIFLEVHRLKGSGGTYGFNEISLIYKEVLLFVRPPHEGKRAASSEEIHRSLEILDFFEKYLPFLLECFGKIQTAFAGENVTPLPAVGLVSQDRRSATEQLEWFCVRENLQAITLQSMEETRFALQFVKPRVLIADHHLPDATGLELLEAVPAGEPPIQKALLCKNSCPESLRAQARDAGVLTVLTDGQLQPENLKKVIQVSG